MLSGLWSVWTWTSSGGSLIFETNSSFSDGMTEVIEEHQMQLGDESLRGQRIGSSNASVRPIWMDAQAGRDAASLLCEIMADRYVRYN